MGPAGRGGGAPEGRTAAGEWPGLSMRNRFPFPGTNSLVHSPGTWPGFTAFSGCLAAMRQLRAIVAAGVTVAAAQQGSTGQDGRCSEGACLSQGWDRQTTAVDWAGGASVGLSCKGTKALVFRHTFCELLGVSV